MNTTTQRLFTTTATLLAVLAFPSISKAQGPGRGGGGGGGGGLPADFQDKIHQLFAHPEKIHRSVDIIKSGYIATTTTADPALAKVLQAHVKQMSGRLSGGSPVRRWDPAFTEFFSHYDDMQHEFTDLENGIRAKVTGTTPEAIAAAQNHAYIILDFSSLGDSQMHQPHQTALDDDGGESDRFHGGPPQARNAKLEQPFGVRARKASADLMKTLGAQLKAAMKAGGPEAALPVCKSVAIPLTENVGKKHPTLSITRVSDRQRNPQNTPDKTDLAALEHFAKSAATTMPVAHLTTAANGNTVRYYQPLRISETCLKCHGDRADMSPDLRTLLDQFYPDDKAHGYKLGDLRGLIRVERKATD